MSVNVYEEMGFSKILSERALLMFGVEDIQSASEWLLRQSTLGSMPKRFKDGRNIEFKYTFFKSRIQIEGEKYLVSDYNSTFNIIEIEPYADNYTDPRWISLSDPSIIWLRERHDTKVEFNPVEDLHKHYLGEIFLPIEGAFMSENDIEKYNQMMQQFNTGPNGLGNLSYYYSRLHIYGVENKNLANIWLSLLSYTDKYNEQLRLVPNIPQPKTINQQRQRHVKTKMWSKMILILEINGISADVSTQILTKPNARASICDLIQSGVDSETVAELLDLFKNYSRPRDYLKQIKRKWTNGCKSMFSIENGKLENGIFSGKLYMSSHIFNNSMAPESKFWIHLQNILQLVKWGKRFIDNTEDCLTENSVVLTENNEFEYVQLSLQEWGTKIIIWCKENHELYFPNANIYNTSAYDHQKMALDWMIEKEMKTLSKTKENWTRIQLDSGFTFYKNLFGNISCQIMNLNQNGGILAQCVGSGKTFTTIQLIHSMNQHKLWRSQHKNNKTLVVVPTSMIGAWCNEFKKWTPDININVYHGNRRKLHDDTDVYITTYRIICHELSPDAFNTTDFSNIVWRRVVLDEGHMIRNIHGKTFKSMMNIKMEKTSTKWVLTATPIVKSMMDMAAYYSFLQIYPFDTLACSYRSCWSTMWALASYSESYPQIAGLLKQLNKSVMFYQNKTTISRISDIFKPIVSDEHIMLQPSEKHKKLLETLFEMTKKRFEMVPWTHMTKLKWLGWLRRAAIDPNFVPVAAFGTPMEKKSSSGMSVTRTHLDNLVPSLKSVSEEFGKNVLNNLVNKDSKCPVCLDVIDCPTVTACGHIFCSECINLAFSNQNGHVKVCPCCRSQLQNSILHEVDMQPITSSEKSQSVIMDDILVGASEVLKETLDDLESLKKESNPKNDKIIEWIQSNNQKVIIFTGYKKGVKSISETLRQNDIGYSIIDGSMSIKQRNKAIESFQQDENVRVFILSKRCASTGISLTAASTIIFYEPCINKSHRKQCIGRIERIGQQSKQLKIITLAMANSIEEKLVENKTTLKELNLIS